MVKDLWVFESREHSLSSNKQFVFRGNVQRKCTKMTPCTKMKGLNWATLNLLQENFISYTELNPLQSHSWGYWTILF